VDRLFKEVLARFGRVDVLVNQCGHHQRRAPHENERDEWDLVLRVNLKGVFNCSQAVIRSMIKERSGRIVNISSVAGQMGMRVRPTMPHRKRDYGIHQELSQGGRFKRHYGQCGRSGYINTEMTSSLPDKLKEAFVQQIPLARVGEPEDVRKRFTGSVLREPGTLRAR